MKKTINLLFASAMTGALIVLGSCSDDDKKSLPKIDGFNNSNEVAADNLVAHWTFDETTEEDISGAAPTNTYGAATTFVDGAIGGAVKLNKSVLKYAPLATLADANELNNFTVSMWLFGYNNKKTAASGFTSYFGLIPANVTDIWPDISANAETGNYLPISDTLQLKNSLNTHPVGGGNSLQDNVAVRNNNSIEDDPNNGQTGAWFLGAQEWVHYVMVWNATTHKFHLYANGADVGGYTVRGTTGNMIMAVPVHPVFGSLASSTIGFAGAPAQQSWNPFATAILDDVRVFNTNLTPAQVGSLYKLGLAGR